MTVATIVKPKARSYKSFFNAVNQDFVMLTKYPTENEKGMDHVRVIQTYWNQIVSRSYFWNMLAKEELDRPSFTKIHNYLRKKLLTECYQAFKNTEKCWVYGLDDVYLKKNLLAEYEDRLEYLKNNF